MQICKSQCEVNTDWFCFSTDVFYDFSVAAAIQGCSAVVCFLTPGYQATVEREEELSYARNMKKPIIKCIVGLKNEFDGYENDTEEDEDEDNTYDWQPSAWLGIMVSDFISVSFEGVNEDNIERKCDELIRKLQNILGKEPSK